MIEITVTAIIARVVTAFALRLTKITAPWFWSAPVIAVVSLLVADVLGAFLIAAVLSRLLTPIITDWLMPVLVLVLVATIEAGLSRYGEC